MSPTRISRWIVLTDLDGTLLDHHNYQAEAAKEALTLLAQHHIPCIFNTSKTFAEVVQLRQQLGNSSPFVCENGSALFIAKNNTETSGFSTDQADYNSEIIATPYADLLRFLFQARQQGFRFRSFNDMPASEVAAMTGLDEQQAWLAKQRCASEPLLWQGDDHSLQQFRQLIRQHKLQLIQGGRFYHLMGDADKASAIGFFRNYYAHQYQLAPDQIGVLALGDGENDRNMLEQSDQPMVIPAACGQPLTLTNPKTITATSPGPAGWNQALLAWLENHC